MLQVHQAFAALGFLFQGLHVCRLGIHGLETVQGAAEKQGVGGLAEHRSVFIKAFVKHRNAHEALAVPHHEGYVFTVVADELGRHFAAAAAFGIETGHLCREFGKCLLRLLQQGAVFRTLNAIAAKGVGLHAHAVALMKEERGQLLPFGEQVHEFGTAFFDLHRIAQGAIGTCFHGVEHLPGIDVQQAHFNTAPGSVRHGEVYLCFRGAGCGQKDRREQELRAFHILRGWLLLWQPFLHRTRGDAPCGNPGLPRSGGEPGGYGCGEPPFRAPRLPPSCRERPP